jgi:hypothetical protein
MAAEFARQLGLHTDTSKIVEFEFLDGRVTVSEGVVRAPFQFQGESMPTTLEFNLMKACTHNIILGNDFLLESEAFTKYNHISIEDDDHRTHHFNHVIVRFKQRLLEKFGIRKPQLDVRFQYDQLQNREEGQTLNDLAVPGLYSYQTTSGMAAGITGSGATRRGSGAATGNSIRGGSNGSSA